MKKAKIFAFILSFNVTLVFLFVYIPKHIDYAPTLYDIKVPEEEQREGEVNSMDERKVICCLCGKEIEGIGNDPWPLKSIGMCCDICNEEVVEARIALITYDDPD